MTPPLHDGLNRIIDQYIAASSRNSLTVSRVIIVYALLQCPAVVVFIVDSLYSDSEPCRQDTFGQVVHAL